MAAPLRRRPLVVLPKGLLQVAYEGRGYLTESGHAGRCFRTGGSPDGRYSNLKGAFVEWVSP